MIRLKTELFPWQQEAVNKLGKLRVGALYMDMSTGKTRTALELFVMRLNAGKVDHALWLCPCNTVVGLPSLLDKHAESWRDYITICGIESLSSSLRINSELLALTKRERVFLVVDESTLVKNYYAKRTNNISRIAQNCPYRYIYLAVLQSRVMNLIFFPNGMFWTGEFWDIAAFTALPPITLSTILIVLEKSGGC